MRSLLKWAGNKYRIITKLKAFLPNAHRLVEPFLGSATIFLNTNYSSYLLADNNKVLIQLYQCLKNSEKHFIEYSRSFFDKKYNNPKQFYQLRYIFNHCEETYKKAALFLYLNKHCFNGLSRVNSKGEFNTPFGHYKKPYFPEKEMLNFIRRCKNAHIIHADFHETFCRLKPGDIVYCDPPYAPLSKTANFTQYTAEGFSQTQQINLAKLAKNVAKKGIPVVISNHDTEFIRDIYKGSTMLTLSVQRNISCKITSRQKTTELIAIFH